MLRGAIGAQQTYGLWLTILTNLRKYRRTLEAIGRGYLPAYFNKSTIQSSPVFRYATDAGDAEPAGPNK